MIEADLARSAPCAELLGLYTDAVDLRDFAALEIIIGTGVVVAHASGRTAGRDGVVAGTAKSSRDQTASISSTSPH